ncbi:MAG: hypothetical protein V4515_12220 [Chloroflexota bacterium]
MTRILAIDPGSERSAWLLWDDAVVAFGIALNDDVLRDLRSSRPVLFGASEGRIAARSVVVIEQIESYGMAVGREVFATVHWSGRFTEAAHPTPVVQLPRRTVKLAICGDSRARDANIRQALLDRFGGSAAVGRKATPGPLYGITRDVWSALAIAITYADLQADR